MVVMECAVRSIWASSCCYGGSYIMLPLFPVRITWEKDENYMQVKMPFKSR